MKTTFFTKSPLIRAALLLCFLGTARAFLVAQTTAMEIEALLETRAVTYAQAARFLLDASEAASIEDPVWAFRFAEERNWLPKNVQPGDAARLDGVSLLLMKSFGLKGGLMYSLTGTAHFAYRELVYQDIIQGRVDPGMTVTGDTLLFITGRTLSLLEN
ncbi:MAG: hypothetical protein FWG99_09705 [Treponema sp.]|nr:hypothetical protein [Treponema sp.]